MFRSNVPRMVRPCDRVRARCARRPRRLPGAAGHRAEGRGLAGLRQRRRRADARQPRARPRRGPLPAQPRSARAAGCRCCARTRAAPRRRAATRATWSRAASSTTRRRAASTMVDRIRRSGYASRAGGWSLGENIAWGTGTSPPPREIHEGLDELRRAPRQHPQARLPRDRHRRRDRRSRPAAARSGRHVHGGLRRPALGGLRARGAGVVASAAPWPTSSPSAPSTTTSTRAGGLHARRRAALRRHRRRAARRARRPLAAQRRRDRPPAAPTAAATPTRTPPTLFAAGEREGVLVRDAEPALWALAQDYTGPDGAPRTRHGLLRARARRGLRPGPHPPARAHAPRARRRTGCGSRAPRRPTSPRSSRSTTTPTGAAWGALEPHTEPRPCGEVTDEDGTRHRLWRVARPGRDRGRAPPRCADTELLIADGHHRYETARVYADERRRGRRTATCSCASSRSRTRA